MNIEKMTEKLQEIFIKAYLMAKDLKNPEISLEHILKMMFQNDDIVSVLNKIKVNVNKLISICDDYISRQTVLDSIREPNINIYVNNAYNEALNTSYKNGDKYLGIFDMFISCLYNNSSISKQLQKELDIS